MRAGALGPLEHAEAADGDLLALGNRFGDGIDDSLDGFRCVLLAGVDARCNDVDEFGLVHWRLPSRIAPAVTGECASCPRRRLLPRSGHTLGGTGCECRTGTLEIGDQVSTLQGDPDVVESLEQTPAHVVVDLEGRDDIAERTRSAPRGPR